MECYMGIHPLFPLGARLISHKWDHEILKFKLYKLFAIKCTYSNTQKWKLP